MHTHVTFQVAPLVGRKAFGKLLPMYYWRPEAFASRLPPHIVVVDGPPSKLGGRVGNLYQLLGVCRPGTLVLLDDASRSDEQDAMRLWRHNLGDAIEVRALEGFAKGLSAILIRSTEIPEPGPDTLGEPPWTCRARPGSRSTTRVCATSATTTS